MPKRLPAELLSPADQRDVEQIFHDRRSELARMLVPIAHLSAAQMETPETRKQRVSTKVRATFGGRKFGVRTKAQDDAITLMGYEIASLHCRLANENALRLDLQAEVIALRAELAKSAPVIGPGAIRKQL